MGPEYFWHGGMWIFPIIMIVVMLVAAYLFFGRGGFRSMCSPGGRHHQGGEPQDPPLEILKKRYASGEISREEFEEMKKDLTS
jgi:putative membrane protein